MPVLGVRVGGFPRHFGMYKNRYLDPPKNFAKSIFSLGSSVLRGWVLLSPEPVHLADCLLRTLQDLTSPRSLKLKPFLRSLKGSEVSRILGSSCVRQGVEFLSQLMGPASKVGPEARLDLLWGFTVKGLPWGCG